MRRSANILLVATFALLLWLPTLDSFLHIDRATAFNEKRMPASFPTLKAGIRGLQDYLQGLEDYFKDHFGFRKQLIRWHLRCQIALFKEKVTQDVLLGSQGWLYYAGESTRRDTAEAEATLLSEKEMADYRLLLERRRDWLAQRGAHYVFVVAPDKQSIYPEHLPPGWKSANARNRLDEFLRYMKQHSTVTVVDLRPALRESKRIAPPYYKTDSHWNDFGGFIACSEISKALAPHLPALRPLSLDSFELKRTEAKGGDLAEMLGAMAIEERVQLIPKPELPPLVESVQNPEFVCPTYFTTNSSATGSAVVFRDSFGTALRPFLGYYFAQVGFFWTVGDFDQSTIEAAKPTVVITEIVERHFKHDRAAFKLQAFAR